jgi:serine phosphatase RsbU (regulator of sigma subunit)
MSLSSIKLFLVLLLTFIIRLEISASPNSKIYFEYIKLDNHFQNWGYLKMKKFIHYDYLDEDGIPQNLQIPSQLKLITIKFSSKSQKNGNFRYKLIGLENRWRKLRYNNEVSYFELKSGNYTFYVQYLENDVIVDEIKFKFTISEPFDNDLAFLFFTFLVYTIIFSIFFSFRTGRLKRNQRILEQTVRERTAEISLQKDEISLQKLIVEEKHREISDSINYAKRIQSALLTSQEYWDTLSAENFVIWRPKDVVSGDFHWAYQLNIGSQHLQSSQEIAVWCAADCTGHGVPGAFMSMLGMSFLNEIVIENVNLKPADILNKLRKKITNALEHGGRGQIEQKDGMDMALCVWNKKTNILEYAGANNPVWIIRAIKDTRAHEIIELKANRMPVGYHTEERAFTEQKFQLQKGDAIYVFTDGFVDQFGGPDGKKYKTKKFKELLLSLQHLNMKDQALMINKEFNEWRGQNEQIDDLCLIGIKVI